ncbi:hypothetical protein HY733_00605 [Candidatus Uhrbacteria bacterium]|nr:hypothetical protein [Candidatus Uhrbacteria bacterium]
MVFVVFRLGTWWFNRGAILSLAPTDTILAAELHLNQQTRSFLSDWLAGIPLISDRELELEDLSPYIHGDLAIFVTKNGDRSVAIRTSKDELPTDLLTQYGILIQEQGPFVFLSSTLVPISDNASLVHRPFLPSLGKIWLGRIVFPDVEIAGNLFVSDHEVRLELRTPQKTTAEFKIIENASLALAGLTWGEEGTPLDGLKRLTQDSLLLREEAHMSIVMRVGEQGLETLVVLRDLEMDSTLIIDELERIGAIARPFLVTETLPDGSNFKEIFVQPESISVEEISTPIGTSFRVPTREGEFILAAIHENLALFSNNQKLLEDYAAAPQNTSSDCTVLTNWLDPTFLLLESRQDYLHPALNILNGLIDDFSGISFEVKKYSRVVHFCRI